jgi:hypothetical protein
MPDSDLRERREAVVREHMESENAREFDRTIETFAHPRYELVATATSSTATRRCASTSTG